MLTMFAIYDSAAKYYKSVWFEKHKADVLREFAKACNDSKTYLNQNPTDFVLFQLGEFDELSGAGVVYDAPERLGVAIEFIKVPGDEKLVNS